MNEEYSNLQSINYASISISLTLFYEKKSIAIKKNIFICCGRGCEQPTSSFFERGIFGIFKKSQIQRKQTEKIVKWQQTLNAFLMQYISEI